MAKDGAARLRLRPVGAAARKKLPEHAHPVLTVLDKNTRAIALYRRMGWKVCGVAEVFDPAKDGSVTARAELLEMRYEGPAEA